MQRLKLELSNRKGFTLILGVLMITVILGAAAFAVDVGHMQKLNRRADVHAAADAAALAGIEKYAATVDESSALAEAQLYASKFKADNATLSLQSADFALGHCYAAPCSSASFVAGGGLGPAQAIDPRHHALRVRTRIQSLRARHPEPPHVRDVDRGRLSATQRVPVTKSTCVAPVVMSLSGAFRRARTRRRGTPIR